MVNAYKEKYPYNNIKNVIVGLSSCSAADKDEQPELIKPVSWIEVKTGLIHEVLQYEKRIIVQKESQIKEREENIRQLLQRKKGKEI